MSPKILVTGATGNIGAFVVSKLQNKKANFVSLVRTEEKADAFLERGLKAVVGDFADKESLSRALVGVEKVFLLSVTSPEAPRLQGNLVEAAHEAGVSHIVKISSLGTSPDSNIGIARYHAAIEEHIVSSGMKYTFLRPQSFTQNLIFDSETIREQGAIYAQMGDGKIAMVDARDIAAVAVEALLNDGHIGKIYDLTGPEALSYNEIAGIFTEVLGKQVKYVPVTSVDARSSMLEAEMPGWLVEDLVAVNTAYSKGEGAVISDAVEKVTGRKGLSIRDFIENFAHLFQ